MGPGRPGWHIECAAIALRHLGPSIDINGGGSDLIFPHHELSAAEAAVVTGAWPFAHAFVHQGMVGYDGEKMSKSRGNLVFVSRLRHDGVDPMSIRIALLAHEPGSDWEWYDDELGLAQSRLTRWREALARPCGPAAQPTVDRLRDELVDGLRTPEALHLVDQWAGTDGDDEQAPAQMKAAIDALLGVV
jgi:L-cysteine:1D-myo-inositol 2-amino-2-deoxy-alpha-D-glucopyranoside ligase